MKRRGFFSLLAGATAAIRLSSEEVLVKESPVIKLTKAKAMTIEEYMIRESHLLTDHLMKQFQRDYVEGLVGSEHVDKYFQNENKNTQ